MAATLKVSYAFLVLLFICKQGVAQPCSLSDISVNQARTGHVVEGQAEYEVVITNNCLCPQSDVQLKCLGFSTVEPVDPTIFKQVDDQTCLINGGQPIFQGHSITFRYAWQTPSDLFVLKSQVSCS